VWLIYPNGTVIDPNGFVDQYLNTVEDVENFWFSNNQYVIYYHHGDEYYVYPDGTIEVRGAVVGHIDNYDNETEVKEWLISNGHFDYIRYNVTNFTNGEVDTIVIVYVYENGTVTYRANNGSTIVLNGTGREYAEKFLHLEDVFSVYSVEGAGKFFLYLNGSVFS